jgi:uracil-DNA glycosylase
MIVADCGTQEDLASGYAITGFNGSFLASCAKDNGLRWDDFWRTCLIKEKGNLIIPEVNNELLSRNAEGIDYRELLKNEISEINPNIIVPLGELSFRYLSGLSGIRKYRGSILPTQLPISSSMRRCLPILGTNPYLNEDYKLRFITRSDFGKLAKHQNDIVPI